MFDMTPFKSMDGAILELNEEEAKEFAEFYNNLSLSDDIWRLRVKYQCIRISFEGGFFYRRYGDRDIYERSGEEILCLNDIRIQEKDFGEIFIDNDMTLSALFAMEDENGV